MASKLVIASVRVIEGAFPVGAVVFGIFMISRFFKNPLLAAHAPISATTMRTPPPPPTEAPTMQPLSQPDAEKLEEEEEEEGEEDVSF